jgi:gamma-glutamyltranspeptidase/glutathione hydrolase
MIATELALAVLSYAGNIGGGGFMVYRKANGVGTLDYREKAPLAASKTCFLDDKGNVIPEKSTQTACYWSSWHYRLVFCCS